MKTNWKCTAYFKGKDGLGTCDDECQWFNKEGCACGKGSKLWDEEKHYTKRLKETAEVQD